VGWENEGKGQPGRKPQKVRGGGVETVPGTLRIGTRNSVLGLNRLGKTRTKLQETKGGEGHKESRKQRGIKKNNVKTAEGQSKGKKTVLRGSVESRGIPVNGKGESHPECCLNKWGVIKCNV